MSVIFYVSDMPGMEVQTEVDDRVAHFLEYFVLGLALMFAAVGFAMYTRAAAWSLLAGVLYAAGDEWHQSFVPGRDPSAGDFLFDCLGLLAAVTSIASFACRAPETGQ